MVACTAGNRETAVPSYDDDMDEETKILEVLDRLDTVKNESVQLTPTTTTLNSPHPTLNVLARGH